MVACHKFMQQLVSFNIVYADLYHYENQTSSSHNNHIIMYKIFNAFFTDSLIIKQLQSYEFVTVTYLTLKKCTPQVYKVWSHVW